PAPLGPMRPVRWPGRTSIETPSTACIPSKWRWTSVASRSGAGSVTTGLGEGSPLLRDDALGPEPEEAENQGADGDPLEGGDQPGLAEGGHVAGRLEEPDRDQDRTQDGAEVVAAAADDDRGEEDDRLRVEPAGRGPEGREADQDRTAQAAHHAADDEHRQLLGEEVLAEGRGGHLVLP